MHPGADVTAYTVLSRMQPFSVYLPEFCISNEFSCRCSTSLSYRELRRSLAGSLFGGFHLLGIPEACIGLAEIFVAFRLLLPIRLFWQRSRRKPFFRGTAFLSSLWLACALFLRLYPQFSSILRLQAPCSLSLRFFSAPRELPAPSS